MKFAFYVSTGKSREAPLRDAWTAGAAALGDELVVTSNDVAAPIDADVAVMVGLKSIDLREACKAAGQRVLIFDKGYDRKEDWWRVSIDAHQPTDYLTKLVRPRARMDKCGWNPKPWRAPTPDGHVIIAGGGRKYYDAHDLPDPADYIAGVVADLRAAGCSRRIWYRPKPSMADVAPVADTTLSRHKSIYDLLKGAHVLVTFGSNACFEAVLAGIPSIVTGDAVMRPISSTRLDEIEAPHLADDGGRLSLLSSLAYCQFRLSEISQGWGVHEIKAQLQEIVRNAPHEQP